MKNKKNILAKIITKVKDNLKIYKRDLKVKGVYWSVIHRLLKIPTSKIWLVPIVNFIKPEKIKLFGNYIYVDKNDNVVSEILITEKQYDVYLTNFLKKKLNKGHVFVDVGAHIGYYTLLAAKLVGKKGKVYSFEPYVRSFKLLKKSVEKNNYKNIILENIAVSDHSGKADLYLSEGTTGDNRIFKSQDARQNIKVDLVSLDDYFEKRNIKIDMIKIDVQGADNKVLKGAENIIKNNKNIVIVVEYFPKGLKLAGENGKMLLNTLKRKKLKIFYINEDKNILQRVEIKKFRKYFKKNNKREVNLICFR